MNDAMPDPYRKVQDVFGEEVRQVGRRQPVARDAGRVRRDPSATPWAQVCPTESVDAALDCAARRTSVRPMLRFGTLLTVWLRDLF